MVHFDLFSDLYDDLLKNRNFEAMADKFHK
jgi:hypothetical protein